MTSVPIEPHACAYPPRNIMRRGMGHVVFAFTAIAVVGLQTLALGAQTVSQGPPAQPPAPQTATPTPPAGIELRGTTLETTIPKSRPPTASTVVVPPVPVPKAAEPAAGPAMLTLVALLSDDGQRIEQGLVWHVFQETISADGRGTRPVASSVEPAPTLQLPAGDYLVLAAFGRAHLTKRVTVAAGPGQEARFVLNAGGLRLNTVMASGEPLAATGASYEILSDDRDQSGNRSRIATDIRPGVVVRLNAGFYHVVASVGDANGQVRADVTVEAGKLTEATVTHDASRVTFKLVPRAGGEALADTQWTISTPQGAVIKETAGALPSHILAPGTYRAVARSGGRSFQRDFIVPPAQPVYVEVVMP